MKLETKINIFCALMIFVSFFTFPYMINYTNKIGGNVLNEGSKIQDEEYYIAVNDGNVKKITKEEWEKNKVLTIVFFIVTILSWFAIFYLFFRYVFIYSFINNTTTLIKFIKKMKTVR